jgi:phosphoglycolate phosphatase-like HAD superfamily hydrolase
MTKFKKLMESHKAILFDVDGTLVDSNDLHAEAWAKAFNHFGRAHSAKDIRSWIGMGGDKILKDLAAIDDQSELGQAISKFRADLFKEVYAPRVRAFAEAGSLIQSLKDRGYLTAIATSAAADELDTILGYAGLRGAISLKTSSDDAEDSKPDPDIIQAALKKARIQSSDALMIGDTPYDIEASLAAGVKVIAVRTGGWSDASLKDADLIVDDVSALNQLINEHFLFGLQNGL